MKNYQKVYQKQDAKYLEDLKKHITTMQEQGNYPKKYEFPTTIQFELTASCNLKCRHCYNRSGDSDIKTVLTPEKWRSLAQEIVAAGGIFQCILSGGEPLLLGEELISLMDVLHDDGTSFVLITNGYYLDEDWINKLEKYRYYWIQISIDGSREEYHNYFRGNPQSWQRAVKAAYLVSQKGLPLVIAHTVTPGNLEHMDEMADLAFELGAASIIFGEVLPSGRANYHQDITLGPEQKNILYSQIESIRARYHNKMEIQRSSSVKHQLNKYQILPNAGVVVRPNGDVRLDCMTPFKIGNILERPLAEIWQEKGNDCWNNQEVLDFIQSIDEETNVSKKLVNYIDRDLAI